MTHVINLDGEHLTLEDVIAVARHGAICEIDQEAKKAVEASRKIVDDIVREKRVVYGVTTGFGSLCNVSISPEDTTQLQENLIRTHASGFGDPLPEDAVRAIMLIRINSLVKATLVFAYPLSKSFWNCSIKASFHSFQKKALWALLVT